MDTSRTKVLLIEDNAGDARLIIEFLTEAAVSHTVVSEFETLQATRLTTGLAYLDEMQIDVILLDLGLPESHGIDTFLQVQQAAPGIPIVVLTGLDDQTMAITAMQHGAQDYLVKGEIDSRLLGRALLYAIERHQLIFELESKSRALAAMEANQRTIIEQNADGIVILDEEGIIRFANPAAEALLKHTYDDLIGKSFGVPLVVNETAELDILRPNGGTAVVEMHLTEMTWEGERAYQASLRDISEHQQAKRLLVEKASELEKRNDELDAFGHTMAHQVQGLLSQMIGYTSFLEMHYNPSLNDEALEIIRRILRSGHKMNSVLSELLLLASVDKNEVPFMPLPMDRIVSEAQKRLSFKIEESDAQIIAPTEWPTIIGYGSWIEEVWVNYISNGIKYGGDPPILELGYTVETDDMARFWVEDNGEGITPEDQERLFKPHTRLRPRRVKGEGLGLSIVYRIVTRCGGRVGVKSSIGEGSTFWFTLPMAPRES